MGGGGSWLWRLYLGLWALGAVLGGSDHFRVGSPSWDHVMFVVPVLPMIGVPVFLALFFGFLCCGSDSCWRGPHHGFPPPFSPGSLFVFPFHACTMLQGRTLSVGHWRVGHFALLTPDRLQIVSRSFPDPFYFGVSEKKPKKTSLKSFRRPRSRL